MCYISSMYTVKDAARILGISEQRVRKLLAEGRIDGKKLGRDWIVFELTYTRKKKRKGGDGKQK